MQLGGGDLTGDNLIVSAVHSENDVARTIEAFDDAIGLLKEDGVF